MGMALSGDIWGMGKLVTLRTEERTVSQRTACLKNLEAQNFAGHCKPKGDPLAGS